MATKRRKTAAADSLVRADRGIAGSGVRSWGVLPDAENEPGQALADALVGSRVIASGALIAGALRRTGPASVALVMGTAPHSPAGHLHGRREVQVREREGYGDDGPVGATASSHC
jgi:hypothetical protein